MADANLPALPNIADARLPATYESALNALAQCEKIDECKDWADKAAALASYAKQARDDSLRLLALRIQERATRRCGQLLKQIPSAQGARTDKLPDGAVRKLTRESVATEAGLSERQRVTALRVANIPEADFKAAVESDDPPTLTKLAMRGAVPRPQPLADIPPADPAEADETQSALKAFAEFCDTHTAVPIALAISPPDAVVLRQYVQKIDAWLDLFVTAL